jgi:hypothetical protein
MVLPSHGDPIRVVPLRVDDTILQPTDEAGAAPPPNLSYRGGPLLAAPEVFTVFWGAAWQHASQSTLVTQLNKFFDDILVSPLIDQLAEYDVGTYKIRHGKRTGSITLATPALHHSVTDSAIQHMLQQEIATSAKFPQPSANTLYFVYLPPGVAVVQGGGRSCQVFCGYHNDINGQIFYAVMPFANCGGCKGPLKTLDALTTTSSHELCEAITDAIPGQGWYDDVHGEIGDICAWHTKKVGGHTVQLEWSNSAGKCV